LKLGVPAVPRVYAEKPGKVTIMPKSDELPQERAF
tara:strand:- start:262 stop:366 length:105 start_codon:yes stop_codon:yes gene_type:complete